LWTAAELHFLDNPFFIIRDPIPPPLFFPIVINASRTKKDFLHLYDKCYSVNIKENERHGKMISGRIEPKKEGHKKCM
jgi:hypothetical protein